MIDISRVGVQASRFFEQYKTDLRTAFDGYETDDDNIYLNTAKTMYINLTKNDNDIKFVLWYNGLSFEVFNTNDSSNLFDYHIIKFDNGVVGLSKISNYYNSSDPHPFASNYGFVTVFFAECQNLATGENEITMFETGDNNRDVANYYNMRSEQSQGRDYVSFAHSTDNVTNSAMTVIAPAFGYARPLTTDKLWLKIKSQQQFGEIVLGGKKYMSCGTFCVPLE